MSLPNAITREDFYLNKIANPSDDHELPDAITRQQHYLKAIAENAGGGGGDIQYSTTEYKIGTWIDDKDVYQCVFIGLNVATQGTSWAVLSTIDSSGWAEVLDAVIYRTNSDSQLTKIPLAECGLSEGGINPQVSIVSSEFNTTITTAIFTYVKKSL